MNPSEKTISGIPAMGYGTWNRYGEEAANGVTWALEAGCHHIDTAQGYDNEEFCGAAIAKSGIPRDEIFVTTKVAPENFGPGEMKPSVEASLEKLRVDLVRAIGGHHGAVDPDRSGPARWHLNREPQAQQGRWIGRAAGRWRAASGQKLALGREKLSCRMI